MRVCVRGGRGGRSKDQWLASLCDPDNLYVTIVTRCLMHRTSAWTPFAPPHHHYHPLTPPFPSPPSCRSINRTEWQRLFDFFAAKKLRVENLSSAAQGPGGGASGRALDVDDDFDPGAWQGRKARWRGLA